MAKSWHGYTEGQRVAVADVVAACRRHLASGKVILKEEKSQNVDQIERCGYETIVYRPQSDGGWGASPLNLNNWRTERPLSAEVPAGKRK